MVLELKEKVKIFSDSSPAKIAEDVNTSVKLFEEVERRIYNFVHGEDTEQNFSAVYAHVFVCQRCHRFAKALVLDLFKVSKEKSK